MVDFAAQPTGDILHSGLGAIGGIGVEVEAINRLVAFEDDPGAANAIQDMLV